MTDSPHIELQHRAPVGEESWDQTQEELWNGDPENARNWSTSRKIFTSGAVSGIGFVCTLASSIYAPGRQETAAEFRIGETVSILPVSLYNLGMAFGPTIASPLSETFGRRAVYLVVLPVFAIFVLATGFCHNFTAVCICRFFAGAFASPGVSIATATVADMWAPSERARPLIIYYSSPVLGSAMGPLVGGFVAESKGWRWTQWTTLFFAITLFSPIMFTRESYKKIILKRKTRAEETRPSRSLNAFLDQIPKFIRTTLIRPVHMLLTEPIVTLLCMYMGFQFGLLYVFVIASPWVFSTRYGFSLTGQSLSFLGLIIGCFLAPMFAMAIDKTARGSNLPRFLLQSTSTPDKSVPEYRLCSAMFGSICLPTGLFWFAWTARSSIHWISPIAAQCLVMIGSLNIYLSAGMYMMDTYGPLYGASANGANSLTRYSLAAAFPLFTLQMYQGIGVGWASSVLGFCALAMAPIPWAFFRHGPKLREKSKYQRSD
ncbi:MFS general substrate transporter [Mytilinidion resinicola]|uniref:MFS general substrate transporter n=1 Tax=Mytilinidion resinicola TaxID=574789 RepID=A0A6A6YP51_9PEZI|nr:MFS general substrate transporter [Mytilinidion resinicola]KAF2809755.1 MFS general substrate transporter [Mytilinidion resinicola]